LTLIDQIAILQTIITFYFSSFSCLLAYSTSPLNGDIFFASVPIVSLKNGCLRASEADILFFGSIYSNWARRSCAHWGNSLTDWSDKVNLTDLFSWSTSACVTPLNKGLPTQLNNKINK